MIENNRDVIEIIDKTIQSINEMATVFDIDKPISVVVYNNEHNPPHIHLGIRNTKNAIRIAIPDVPFENQEQIKNLVLPEDKELIPKFQKYFKALLDAFRSTPKGKHSKRFANELEHAQSLWCDLQNIDDAQFKAITDIL